MLAAVPVSISNFVILGQFDVALHCCYKIADKCSLMWPSVVVTNLMTSVI